MDDPRGIVGVGADHGPGGWLDVGLPQLDRTKINQNG